MLVSINYLFAFTKLNIVGSFNNWDLYDKTKELIQVEKELWELETYFEKGEYKFKFVMDNSWSEHRGIDEKGKLIQPGSDINLKIPVSGFYKISVDFKKNEWLIEKIDYDKIIAKINPDNFYLVNQPIKIFAKISNKKDDKKTYKFQWTQKENSDVKLSNFPIINNEPQIEFIILKKGSYIFYLEIFDEDKKITATSFQINVKESYQIKTDLTNEIKILPEIENNIFINNIKIDGENNFIFYLFKNFNFELPYGSDAKESLQVNDEVEINIRENGEKIIFNDTGVFEFIYNENTKNLKIKKLENYYHFIFEPDNYTELKNIEINKVAISGDFNNFDKTKNELTKNKNFFETIIKLEEGYYNYQYLINDEIFIPSEKEKLKIFVGEKIEEGKKDGINYRAIKHKPNQNKYLKIYTKNFLEIILRTKKDDVQNIYLFYKTTQKSDNFQKIKMKKKYEKNGFDYYNAYLKISDEDKIINYYFQLEDGNQKIYFTKKGIKEKDIKDEKLLFSKRNELSIVTPDWAKNVIWYQIMVDRFRNGDKTNDPENTLPWRWDWFKPYTEKEKKNFYGAGGVWERYFGGDLQGLIEKLDYLQDLGVTAIYLNPMFEANSHHKYNTTDYRHIDDNFGFKDDIKEVEHIETIDSKTWQWTKTDNLFLDFLKIAKDKGFKIILDGVFNHSGTEFWAFKDIVKNREKSQFKDWYVIKDWNAKPEETEGAGFLYEGWCGFLSLPDYAVVDNDLNVGIRNHIYDITVRWLNPTGNLEDGIDGWRLDVPEWIVKNFWTNWRKVVKSVNPNAYIVGEIWGVVPDWLNGGEFDAIMNYEWNKILCKYFYPGGKTKAIKTTEFINELLTLLESYSYEVNFVLQNLLSSHDIDRIVSAIYNRAGWKQGRIQDDNPDYNSFLPDEKSYEIMKLIIVFQMLYAGAPMIYYGDEVGMYGADDPANRMAMWWEDLMPYDNLDFKIRYDLLEHYKYFIAMRNTFPVFRCGAINFLFADDEKNILVFERTDGESYSIIILNNSSEKQSIEFQLPDYYADFQLVDISKKENVNFINGKISGLNSVRKLLSIKKEAETVLLKDRKLKIDLSEFGWCVLINR